MFPSKAAWACGARRAGGRGCRAGRRSRSGLGGIHDTIGLTGSFFGGMVIFGGRRRFNGRDPAGTTLLPFSSVELCLARRHSASFTRHGNLPPDVRHAHVRSGSVGANLDQPGSWADNFTITAIGRIGQWASQFGENLRLLKATHIAQPGRGRFQTCP